jgi:uncharacterized membrane protein YcaP (DUF421 family)
MHLGVTWPQAGAVVLSAVGIYLAFLVLIRLAGPRALAAMSSFDFAAAVAFGAVVGRVVLGDTPTLEAGVIGLATLFCLQAVFSVVRRNARADALLSNLPLLLMAEGKVLEDNLRSARMVESELNAKLRQVGIRRYEDVACVILERTGAVSVLHRGETISAQLLGDVRGREAIAPGTVD